jgi:hypothetical protein
VRKSHERENDCGADNLGKWERESDVALNLPVLARKIPAKTNDFGHHLG